MVEMLITSLGSLEEHGNRSGSVQVCGAKKERKKDEEIPDLMTHIHRNIVALLQNLAHPAG